MNPDESLDLLVLVADADIEQTVKGLLERTSLGFRSLRYEVQRHTGRDPGCRTGAVDFLRPFQSRCQRAIVLFDRHGCGSSDSREAIQQQVERELFPNGWEGRAKAIVIEPELEVWLWNGSRHAATALGWSDHSKLRRHLQLNELWPDSSPKPPDPKRAAHEAMRSARLKGRVRRSPEKFSRLARQIGVQTLDSCEDPAFVELLRTLREWFPSE